LKNIEKVIVEKFISSTLNIFDKIAYPDYDKSRLSNTVKEIDFVVQEDSIISAAEKSLSTTGVGKIKTDIDFDTLEFLFKGIRYRHI